jgi:ATP-dependent Clp protease ATP-binding subunit ClpA
MNQQPNEGSKQRVLATLRRAGRGLTVAADWLGEKGYDDKMGARPLGRVIQEHIKKPLAEELLFGKLTKGGTVHVGVKDGTLHLTYEEPQKPRLTGQKPPLLTAE